MRTIPPGKLPIWHVPKQTAWNAAHPDDPFGAYHQASARRAELQGSLTQERHSTAAVTIEVGLKGRVQRLPDRYMRALRRVEPRRLTPERPSPLDALVEDQQLLARLRAQGKIEAAAAIEASIQRLVAHMAGWPEAVQQRRRTRQAWGWKPLWITPGETPLEDVQFTLMLYVLQAQVVECSPVCSRFLATYMRQFKYAVTQEEERLLEKRFQWDQGGTGFVHVLRSYAQPEDARALRRYIARTLRGREASEARIRAAQEQNLLVPDLDEVQNRQIRKYQGQPDPDWDPHTPGGEEPSTASLVDEVVRMLREEAAGDEWVPSRDTLYDWGNRGQFSWCRDGRGRKALDAHGIAQIRNLVRAKRTHRALVQRALAASMSRQAIKKAHQRGRLEAIVIWHERRQDLFAVDATGPEGEEVSIEGVCAYIEGRLAYDDLKQAERDDLLMKLVDLRRRLAAMDHTKFEQDS